MDRSSLCPESMCSAIASARFRALAEVHAGQSASWAVRPSAASERTVLRASSQQNGIHQSRQLPVAQITSPAVRPSAASARGHFAEAALPLVPLKVNAPQCAGPTARGLPSLLRASTASRSSGSQCKPCESRSLLSIRSLQPVAHELKQMPTALKSAPNRSVEATSNGWPHRASCSFLALCGQPSAAPHLLR
jgi:hypothetical protein